MKVVVWRNDRVPDSLKVVVLGNDVACYNNTEVIRDLTPAAIQSVKYYNLQ